MKNRVYILIKPTEGNADRLALILRRQPGVLMADVVDEPDRKIMLIVEAAGKRELGGYLSHAIASVDTLTEDLRVLLPREAAV